MPLHVELYHMPLHVELTCIIDLVLLIAWIFGSSIFSFIHQPHNSEARLLFIAIERLVYNKALAIGKQQYVFRTAERR